MARGFEGVRKTFLIFFMARSGSSWLTDLCTESGRVGRPGEIFNFNNKRFANWPLKKAVPAVVRKNTYGGVFGAEVAWGHMKETFGGPETLFGYFPATPLAFLIREDIVLQAVSSMRKSQTGVGHHRDGEKSPRDRNFVYDAEFLRKNVNRRIRIEKRFDEMFATFEKKPLRLSYERNMKSPLGALNAIARLIDEPGFNRAPRSSYSVMRTGRSEEFAERFREENPEFIDEVNRRRRRLLRQLDDY